MEMHPTEGDAFRVLYQVFRHEMLELDLAAIHEEINFMVKLAATARASVPEKDPDPRILRITMGIMLKKVLESKKLVKELQEDLPTFVAFARQARLSECQIAELLRHMISQFAFDEERRRR